MRRGKKMTKQQRTEQIIYRCLAFGIVLLVTLSILLANLIKDPVFAAIPEPEVKCFYTSYEIQKGDTLWKLAKENKKDNESVHDYLKKVVFINGLESEHDTITAGHYLILPYYEVEE